MKGSLKKRGDNWYAIVDIRDPSGNRKQKWINTKCEKKPDAEKALREILQKIDNNSFINPEKITFTEFLRDWLENIAKGKVEYTTWQGYDLMLKSHIVPYFHQSCNVKLQDLKPIHLQKYFEFKYRKDADGCGLSPSTLRKHYACMSGALEHAVKMDLIPSNPIRKVTLPKKEKFKGNFYTAEQIEKLLEVALGTPIESAVYLAVTLGLRRAEVLGLKWKHIDLDDDTLTIQETRVKFLKNEITKEPKNASSKRTLPLSDNLVEYLKILKKRRKKNKELYGDAFKNDGYVCCWDDGTPLTTDYLNHKFKALLKAHELPHIRFHDLRHSTASYLLKQGISMKEISVWLGHSSIGITMDTYSHLDAAMKLNSANALNMLQRKPINTRCDNDE